MFMYAYNFNQPVTIPNSVTTAGSMFYGANRFNSPVTIGDNVKSCSYLFGNATNYAQPTTFPSNVTDVSRAFANIAGVNDIYFERNEYGSITTEGMLYNKLNTVRTNVHFNPILNNLFNVTNAKSIMGAAVTWTDMEDGNGFYNETRNVYCYNNYVV